MDEKTVRVWTTTNKDGKSIRVATIEQNERKEASCKGCSAPCCKGALLPVLTEDELRSKKFPVQLVAAPDWLKEQVPRAQYLAVLKMNEQGCPYFNFTTHLCNIYPNCPVSCLSYDCHGDERMIEIWKTGSLSKEIKVE